MNVDEAEELFHHHRAFGARRIGNEDYTTTGLSVKCKLNIEFIRDNIDIGKKFELDPLDSHCFTRLSWELLGRYIANSIYLEEFNLYDNELNDEKMSSLFDTLIKSDTIKELHLHENNFGIEEC